VKGAVAGGKRFIGFRCPENGEPRRSPQAASTAPLDGALLLVVRGDQKPEVLSFTDDVGAFIARRISSNSIRFLIRFQPCACRTRSFQSDVAANIDAEIRQLELKEAGR